MCEVVKLSLANFSTELLLEIFQYLSIYDLCQLKQTCKRFNDLINAWGHNFIKKDQLNITHQNHLIINRSGRILSPFESLRISRNWLQGIYKEKNLLHSKTKYMPWLQLEKNLVWIGRGAFIKAYRRNENGIDPKREVHSISGRSCADICRFVVKDNHIAGGRSDGSLWLWSRDTKNFIFDYDGICCCHEGDINAVDMLDDTIVTGGRDNWVKVWRKPSEGEKNASLVDEINLWDRIWSVALSDDTKTHVAIGTAGVCRRSSLAIYDLIKQSPVALLGTSRLGAGILGIQWETASTVWTCGYDATLRLWDLRTNHWEKVLEDPLNSTIYCFQSDGFNSIVSGSEQNGRVMLWDTRWSDYRQIYFMDCCKSRYTSSPVYSLAYDAEYLFNVTDQHLNILNFSVYRNKSRNYTKILKTFN